VSCDEAFNAGKIVINLLYALCRGRRATVRSRNTIKQDLKDIGMSWKMNKSVMLTEKTGVDV